MPHFQMINRIPAEELLDRPDTPPADIAATLREQAWINRWLGGGATVWKYALPAIRRTPSQPVRLLEIGCGGCDITRQLVDRCRAERRQITATCLDHSSTVLAYAREQCRSYPEISLAAGDATALPFLDKSFDLVLLPTVLHHLTDVQVVTALREAGRVYAGTLIVSDLIRSPLAYHLFILLARLLPFSPISIHDGAVSLQRAFTPAELLTLAHQAGLSPQLHRHFYDRMTLVQALDKQSKH